MRPIGDKSADTRLRGNLFQFRAHLHARISLWLTRKKVYSEQAVPRLGDTKMPGTAESAVRLTSRGSQTLHAEGVHRVEDIEGQHRERRLHSERALVTGTTGSVASCQAPLEPGTLLGGYLT
jgi:hypothetical protein